VPAFVLLPVFALWYIGSLPTGVWESALGKMPTATRYANLILIFSAVTFVLSLLTLFKPKKIPLIFALLIFGSAFVTMWSFEFIREAIRKPYLIHNYMYVNSIFKEPVPGSAGMSLAEINQQGVLKAAKWVKNREVTDQNRLEAGREIFRVECQSCHTIDGYRSMRRIIQRRNWSYSTLRASLGSLDKMFNGVMPPFAGTEEEKEALAHFIISLAPGHVPGAPSPGLSGEAVFDQYCSTCHQKEPDDPMFAKFGNLEEQTIYYLISKLDSLNPEIPPFEGTDQERQALAEWIEDEFK
jgi:mono/diheme cytochrome c family protein